MRMESMSRENQDMRSERAALRRRLTDLEEQGTLEVRRSLARRKQAQQATQHHEQLSQELDAARSELQVHIAFRLRRPPPHPSLRWSCLPIACAMALPAACTPPHTPRRDRPCACA